MENNVELQKLCNTQLVDAVNMNADSWVYWTNQDGKNAAKQSIIGGGTSDSYSLVITNVWKIV